MAIIYPDNVLYTTPEGFCKYKLVSQYMLVLLFFNNLTRLTGYFFLDTDAGNVIFFKGCNHVQAEGIEGIIVIDKSKIIKEAQKFVAKGQLDKAVAEYARIVKDFPNDTNTHNTIGDLHMKRGDKESAIVSFRTAADILNKDGFALKAIALYKKVLNINPDQVDVQMQMGKLNAERGMLGNANENYLAAVAYFTKQGRKDRTLDVYKILCNLNPNNMALAQKLAELYLSEGMVNEGVGKYIELAEKKANEGDIQAARQFLANAKPKGHDRHDYGRVEALVNLKDGRLPEAVKQLEELRELDHTDFKVSTLLADAYLMSGRYEEAAFVLEDQLVTVPANTELRYKLINIYIKAGIYTSAWNHYRFMIDAHIEKNEFNKAEKLVNEYLVQDPDNIEARQILVDLYSNIGRNDKISVLYAEIAGIHARTGNPDKAANIYSKLIEADPKNDEVKAAYAKLVESMQHAGEEPAVPALETPSPDSHQDIGGPIDTPHPATLFGQEDETGFEFQPEEELQPEAASETVFDSIESAMPDTEASEETESPFGIEPPSMSFGQEDEEDVEHPGEGNIYDLSDMPDELPPLDLGSDTYSSLDGIPGFRDSTFDISTESASGLDGLDIFKQDEDEGEAPEESGEIKLVTGFGSLDISDLEDIPAESTVYNLDESPPEPPVYDLVETPPAETYAPPSGPPPDVSSAPAEELHLFEDTNVFDDRLTEIDVYIKYGLFPKAIETLGSLETSYPSSPEVQLRYLELCKAEGDVDGFVDRSLRLAGIYKGRGLDDEAGAVIEKALALAPDNERLLLVTGGQTSETFEEEEAEDIASGYGQEEYAQEEEEHAISMDAEDYSAMTSAADVSEDLVEADFYAQQGLVDEASAIYRRLLASDPENDVIRKKYDAFLDTARLRLEEMEQPEPEPEEAPAQVALESQAPSYEAQGPARTTLDDELDAAFSDMDFGEEPEGIQESDEPASVSGTEGHAEGPPAQAEDEDDGFFDLAAELRDEMGADIITPMASPSYISENNLDAVFQEFKRGVEDQVGSEDYDTHYNLGIAYKEMGMIDDALAEFTQASRDPSRALDCASMLGLCYIEKGEYAKALEYFGKGLAVQGRDKEEYLGLKYDMATVHELAGDMTAAFAVVSDIFSQDENFRDVKKRKQRLEKAAADAQQQAQAKANAATPKPKNKVSYL